MLLCLGKTPRTDGEEPVLLPQARRLPPCQDGFQVFAPHRFRHIVVHACRQTFLAITLQRIGRQYVAQSASSKPRITLRSRAC